MEDEVEPARGLRVLVVDDNRDSADSLAMWLELAGFDRHLVKPVDPQSFKEMLARIAAGIETSKDVSDG